MRTTLKPSCKPKAVVIKQYMVPDFLRARAG